MAPRLFLSLLCLLAASLSARPKAPSIPRLPRVFEPNRGQAPPPVRFLSRGPGGTLLFRDDAVHLTEFDTNHAVTLRPRNKANTVLVTGVAPLPGVSNYIIDKQTIPSVPHFERLRYQGWFPGIDIFFYPTPTGIEFDAVVLPGADPSQIDFRLTDFDTFGQKNDGSIFVHAGTKRSHFGKPVAYQMTPRGRVPVSCRYRLTADGFRFDIGRYDPTLPLIIDPTLATTYLGGRDADLATAVTTDSSGNIYVTGYTASTNFPTAATPVKSSLTPGDADAFVTKLNPTATAVLYSTYIGGAFADIARAIAVDSTGAAYITGSTIGRFPVTLGAFRTQPANAPAIFAAKLDSTGSSLVYATYLDGAGSGNGIAVDSTGNAFIAGSTYTATFTTTAGAYSRSYAGATDAIVTKLNPTGTAQVYSTFIGGVSEDQAMAIRIDSSGAAFVAGFTSSSDFPFTPGAYRTAYSGATDGFALKLSPDGSALAYSTFLGGSSLDRAYAIDISASGEAYVAGQTYSSSFPTTVGAYRATLAGGSDAFITRLNAAGSSAVFSTFLGGSGTCTVADPFQTYQCDAAYAIALDSSSVWVAGLAGSSFPLSGSFQASPGGNGDAFLAQLSLTGASLLLSTYIGGGSGELARGLAVDPTNGPIAVGFTRSSDLPATAGSLHPISGGGTHEGFLARAAPCTVTLGSSGSFFPNSSGAYTLAVFSPTSCAWTATSDVAWITISSPSNSGNASLSYTVTTNTGPFRVGHITIGSQIFTVQQVTGLCVTPASTGSWHPQAGGSFSLAIFATCAWNATTGSSFITITSGAGSGNGTVNYSVSANGTGSSRSGTIEISGQTFTVNQVGGPGAVSCTFLLSSAQESFTSAGGSASVLLLASEGCEWSVINPNPWITLTAGFAGNGDGIIGFTAAPNTTGQVRTALLIIAGQNFLVSQSGI